jgi:hypothetical protein
VDDIDVTEVDDLERAEHVLDRYAGSPTQGPAYLVTDEAELLRGCLYALVANGRRLEAIQRRLEES